MVGNAQSFLMISEITLLILIGLKLSHFHHCNIDHVVCDNNQSIEYFLRAKLTCKILLEG